MKKVLIIGSGRRVQQTILPAVYYLRDTFRLVGIYSRKKKILRLPEKDSSVRTITNLDVIDFDTLDLIIVAVTTENVPDILQMLSHYSLRHIILFLDTPVLRMNHLWAIKYFSHFRSVYVTEDFVAMQNFRIVKKIIGKGKIGRLRTIFLFHSGFKHHALAIIRTIASSPFITSLFIRTQNSSVSELFATLPDGVRSRILLPRDYRSGRFLAVGERGHISDYPLAGDGAFQIEYLIGNGHYRGVRVIGKMEKPEYVRIRYQNIVQPLGDETLMNVRKIEGCVNLFLDAFRKKPYYNYTYEDGIYDAFASYWVYRFGWFVDFRLPLSDQSVVRWFLRMMAPRLSSLVRQS
jgi:hypothetical protein